MIARSGATGEPGHSAGGKKAKFSQIAQTEPRKSQRSTATRYQTSSACTMFSGIDSSSLGEKSSKKSTSSSTRSYIVSSFQKSRSLTTFPRPHHYFLDEPSQ